MSIPVIFANKEDIFFALFFNNNKQLNPIVSEECQVAFN